MTQAQGFLTHPVAKLTATAPAVVVEDATAIQIATRLRGDSGTLHPLGHRKLYSVFYNATRRNGSFL
jgi:hypothetical protein